jgi:hypothetical protein
VDRSDRDDNELQALVAEQAVKSVTESDTVAHYMNLLESGLGATGRTVSVVTTPKKVVIKDPEEVEDPEEDDGDPPDDGGAEDPTQESPPKVSRATRGKARMEEARAKKEAAELENKAKSPRGKADAKAGFKRPRASKTAEPAKKKARVLADTDIPSDEG